ncbi:MAG: GNAT family protein [Anaerolineales bacterium]|jgi:RimJ/RimL family protein N-acetyltransferase
MFAKFQFCRNLTVGCLFSKPVEARISTMLKPPELLETSRLLLRLPVLEDTEAFFRKCAQDREFAKYLVWQPHENINVTRDFIHRCIHCWQDETAFPWIVVRKNDHELVGIIELRIDKFRADLGYGIAPEYWGNGYATEITKSVIAWALLQENIYRVWATCDVDNFASARVLEKAGMQKEGILRRYILHPNVSPEPRDSYCYSVVK